MSSYMWICNRPKYGSTMNQLGILEPFQKVPPIPGETVFETSKSRTTQEVFFFFRGPENLLTRYDWKTIGIGKRYKALFLSVFGTLMGVSENSGTPKSSIS